MKKIDPFLFASITQDKKRFYAVLSDSSQHILSKLSDITLNGLIAKIENNGQKLVAATIPFNLYSQYRDLFWLKYDVVPLSHRRSENQKFLAQNTAARFSEGVIKINKAASNQIISYKLATISKYQKFDKSKFINLKKLASRVSDKPIVFISSTPRGGGVSLMRHSLVRLACELNVDLRWYTTKERPGIFEITKKKFHNNLQGVNKIKLTLNSKDKQLFKEWSRENAELLLPQLKDVKTVVIDDPQPSGIIPYIRKKYPKTKIIYRSHIQIDTNLVHKENTPNKATWDFLKENILDCDLFISHPIKDFVPKEVDTRKLLYMPATTDRLDGLNKPLNKAQTGFYLNYFNSLLKESGQSPLDLDKAYITQIARFDPSKGIDDLLEAYKKLTDITGEMTPQLVIAGNRAIDDPEALPIIERTKEIVNSSQFKYIKNNIKIALLPHIDQLLDTVIRESLFVLQLSHKEGYEIKISEALVKGKPVVVYDGSGASLQVKDKVNGFVVPKYDITGVAEACARLVTNKTLYKKMSRAAIKKCNSDVWEIDNLLRWLTIHDIIISKKYLPNGKYLKIAVK